LIRGGVAKRTQIRARHGPALLRLGQPRGMVSNMFGIGITELLIVLGILLLLFGSRLPSIARSMGKSITEFKRGMHDEEPVQDQVEHK
jgi:sec-independent protein translocase protein TatA